MDQAKVINRKHRLRQLKKQELRLRFAGREPGTGAALVFDAFFSLGAKKMPGARFDLNALTQMQEAEFEAVIQEYYYSLYYRWCMENGHSMDVLFDPQILKELGLPPDADEDMVKRRFRKMAMDTHPDRGGNPREFIRITESYRKLMQNKKK